MYLLHWRGSVPFADTLEAFKTLKRDGKIRHWGVSNLDTDDMEELEGLTVRDRTLAAANQVLYNLMRRGIEFDLLPWCETRRIPIMAYSPLEQGRLERHKTLRAISERLKATPSQVALAWVLRQPGVMTIPKAGRVEHVRENHGALSLQLAPEDLTQLDAAFAPPKRKTLSKCCDVLLAIPEIFARQHSRITGMIRVLMLTKHFFCFRLIGLPLLLTVLASADTTAQEKAFEPTPGQPGKDVVWVPTPQELVEKMLDMAKVTPQDLVIDLGSGDGRNVIAAAKRGARAIGVEYNPDMVALSRRSRERGGRRRPGDVRRGRHVRGRHLEGHGARAVPAAEQPATSSRRSFSR